MKELFLFEEINCKRTHVYDHYVSVKDPFKVPRLTKRKNGYIKNTMRLINKLGANFVELTITDNNMLNTLKGVKDTLLVRRFIRYNESDNYFCKKLICNIYEIYDKIVIFKIIPDERNIVIFADELKLSIKQMKREHKLDYLTS